MALAPIRGKLTDAGGKLMPALQQSRLWAVPSRPTVFGAAVMTDDEVLCNLNPATGEFTVQLDNAPGLRYTLWLDRLPPGQETEPPERRSRNWVLWKEPFAPGAGGDIGDLPPTDDQIEIMWIGPTPPPTFREGTRWLDSNPDSADFGWIKKWRN